MQPRRLLVVIDEMEVGGSQRQVVQLLTHIDRARWQPELLYFRHRSSLVDDLERAGIPVHHIAKRHRLDPGFAIRLGQFLRREHHDLVHAFSLTAELWMALALALSGRSRPLVASVRGLSLEQPWWQWRIKRWVLGRSAAVIANARAGAAAVASHTGVTAASFDVIGNGIEIPAPMPAHARDRLRASIGVPPGRALGLFVGRLVAVKNLPCLLHALAGLPAGRRPWIALAGDGGARSDIESLARTLGVDGDVAFLGERSDAMQLMQAADFLVLPSHHEGLSNALLEAMAAGCPVIASDAGGTPELVEHERDGLLFPSGDHRALGALLARITRDDALRARLSRCAREHVAQRYGIPALIASTLDVYDRCVAMPGHRPQPDSFGGLLASSRGDGA